MYTLHGNAWQRGDSTAVCAHVNLQTEQPVFQSLYSHKPCLNGILSMNYSSGGLTSELLIYKSAIFVSWPAIVCDKQAHVRFIQEPPTTA